MATAAFLGRAETRVPPHDLEAEASVLGALMIDPGAITRVLDLLDPEDFYRENHAQVYRAALNLFREGEPIDNITVAAELEKMGVLERVGGRAGLALLAESVPTAANVEYYARIVKDKSYKRRLIAVGATVTGLGYDDSLEAEEAVNQAQSAVYAVSDDRLGAGMERLYDLLKPAMDRIDAQMASGGAVVGIPSGFHDLDRLTNGFKPSDLIVIAGRPAMGKTSFVLNVALHAAVEHRKPTAIFSLEMSKEQLVERMLCEQARIDAQRLHRGILSEAEYERLAGALGPLGDAPIFIDDSPVLDDLTLRLKARQARSREGIELIIVDYLQLMHGRSRHDDGNRVQEVSAISRSLKSIARELRVPVLAISQLSRAPEARPDKRPILSDLRESGCLTGESRVYLPDEGLYRPIRELVGKSGFRVLAADDATWRLEPREVVRAFSTGRKPVLRLTTRLGHSIRATGNHKFLAFDGWRRLDDMAPGMRLAAPRALPGVSAQTMGDAELALLGHLIGDGCTLLRHAVQYTTKDPDLAKLVAELAADTFGDSVQPRIKAERDCYQVYLAATSHLTHGTRNPVAEWLDRLGAVGLRAPKKHVPDTVFGQPPEAIARFLRHLWATDGCLWSRGAYPVIRYDSSSERLVADVQSLLLRLGIVAKRRVVQFSGGQRSHRLDVTGKADAAAFLSLVGAVGERKVRTAAEILRRIEAVEANTNRDTIPAEAWRSLVVPAMQASGVTTRALHAGLGTAYCSSTLYKSGLSRERARRVAAIVESESMDDLATSDVYWDEVVSIEPDGEAEVYDLTVEGLHSFVANDIVVHNSIEQDSDIVMFLYRDDYYNREKSEKPGIAEVIVAKHRNGPTGTVELVFRRELTRFENLERRRPDPTAAGP